MIYRLLNTKRSRSKDLNNLAKTNNFYSGFHFFLKTEQISKSQIVQTLAQPLPICQNQELISQNIKLMTLWNETISKKIN